MTNAPGFNNPDRAGRAARESRFELPASRWSSSVSYSLGPTSRVAPGNSSVVADKLALGLADYVVTESGFGSECGFALNA